VGAKFRLNVVLETESPIASSVSLFTTIPQIISFNGLIRTVGSNVSLCVHTSWVGIVPHVS
jgi:hypothetical protein